MRKITIYEVGPRDGLQNIDYIVPTETKLHLIDTLQKSGLRNIEVTSFAHPKLLPQMSDAEEVFRGQGSALVMNQKGMERVLDAGVTHFNIVFSLFLLC